MQTETLLTGRNIQVTVLSGLVQSLTGVIFDGLNGTAGEWEFVSAGKLFTAVVLI